MKRQSAATIVSVIVLAMLMTTTGRGDLSEGLVAYYPFSGNANDASGNGHDGVVHGATLTVDRFGAGNSAYRLDGINDYISVAYATPFQFPAFTLAAWICPARDLSPGNRGVAIAARGEDSVTDRLWSSFEIVGEQNSWGTGITLLYENNADTECVYDTGLYPQSQSWTHIAATRSVSGEVTVYSNGAVIGHWDSTPVPSSMCPERLRSGQGGIVRAGRDLTS